LADWCDAAKLQQNIKIFRRCTRCTLIVDRAATRAWRRQVLDLLSWGILTNSLAWWNNE
jgi:phage terminase small subunit